MNCPHQEAASAPHVHDPRDPCDIATEVLQAIKNGKRIEYLNPSTGRWTPRKKTHGLPNFSKHQYRVMVEPVTVYALVKGDGTFADMPSATIPEEIPEGMKLIELRENKTSQTVKQKNARIQMLRARTAINSAGLGIGQMLTPGF